MALTHAEAIEHLRLAATVAGIEVGDITPPTDRDLVVDGLRLHYLDWGRRDGPPLLFLHGGCLTAHTWDLVCLALRGSYWSLALDQRGHGDSEWSPTLDYGPEAHARDIGGFLEQLELAAPVLIGHSLGGLNAMTYAIQTRVPLGGIVMVDVGPIVELNAAKRVAEFVMDEPTAGSVEEFVARARAFNPRRDPRLLRYSLLHNLRQLPDGSWTWKYDRRGLSDEWFDYIRRRLEQLKDTAGVIDCPVLVVRGAESESFSDDQAAAFAGLFSRGSWTKVDEAGHTIQGDNPRGLVRVLVEFMSEIGVTVGPAGSTAHRPGVGIASGETAHEAHSPVTLADLAEKKRRGQAIVMLTAYDYPSAQAVEEAEVDLVLAGDTGAEVVLGHPTTTRVSFEEMLHMTAAVRRGLHTPLLIGDLPFGSYEACDELAVRSAQRLVKEAGADVVKLERGGTSAERARAIAQAGIPVMGHVGLTPQTEASLGGRRAQGRTAQRALELLEEAQALQDAGCFAIVLEAVPAPVAAAITARLEVPTIGIGAGSGTDGQVVVWHDLLGLYEWRPRFAKAFCELRPTVVDALLRYAAEVRAGTFPAGEHEYAVEDRELAQFLSALARDRPVEPGGAASGG